MKKLLLSFALVSVITPSYAQQEDTKPDKPAKKIALEHNAGIGTFTYGSQLVDYEVNPETWRGYYISEETTGVQISIGTGVRLWNRLHVNANVAYARYAAIDGVLAYGSLQYDLLKTRLTPILRVNAGYSHFWNQYDGGTGTELLEYGLGARYQLTRKNALQLTAGGRAMQTAGFFVVNAGVTF